MSPIESIFGIKVFDLCEAVPFCGENNLYFLRRGLSKSHDFTNAIANTNANANAGT
jgi:hypothetical protein